MSDITINYKGNAIATMDASGTKTLLTEGKYLEDDVEVVYVSPGGGGTPAQVATGTFTGSGGQVVTINCSFEPDLVYIVRSDYASPTAITTMSVGMTAICRNQFMFYNRFNANATSSAGNAITEATGTASTTRPTLNYFTYSSGVVTYLCNQGNAAAFSNALTYNYTCIKYT